MSAPWKDSNGFTARGAYGAIVAWFKLKRAGRELRSVSGLTWTTLVCLVLALALRSWILTAAFLVGLSLNATQWAYYRYYISKSGLEGVDEMTGWEFEKWLRRFLEQTGYQVEPTPYQGDFGADFVLTWNGTRIAAQAKRSSRPVGVRAVQEAVAARAHYGCERAMVITNNYYTEQAVILARTNGVWLRCRDDLAKKLTELAQA